MKGQMYCDCCERNVGYKEKKMKFHFGAFIFLSFITGGIALIPYLLIYALSGTTSICPICDSRTYYKKVVDR